MEFSIPPLRLLIRGGLTERFIVPDLKSGDLLVPGPWVRSPHPPLFEYSLSITYRFAKSIGLGKNSQVFFRKDKGVLL